MDGAHEGDGDAGAFGPDVGGVPLGGLGAGCIEFGPDGFFRQATINNNRTAAERIAVLDGAFLAIRAGVGGAVHTRVLQPAVRAAIPRGVEAPQFTTEADLTWTGLYPCAHYTLKPERFPLGLRWTVLSPIIPYDLSASTLPLIYFSLHFTNPFDEPVHVSALLNWENLNGCVAGAAPAGRGPIRPVVAGDDAEVEGLDGEEADEARRIPPRPAGLEFGTKADFESSHHGNYVVVAKQQEGHAISLMAWHAEDPREAAYFWSTFARNGQFQNKISRHPESHAGAVCSSFELPPHRGRTVVFILAWYCPRFDLKNVDVGNAYTNDFPDAASVANRGIKYYKYFFDAVQSWHGRFLNASLPPWFARMLLNSTAVLSTNSIYTREGHFALVQAADCGTTSICRWFDCALGLALFFPELEERMLALYARETVRENGATPDRLASLDLPGASGGAHDAAPLEPALKFVLLVCRDYLMTGKLFTLEAMFPALQAAMAFCARHDEDGDGLLEHPEPGETANGVPVRGTDSHLSGLWLAALCAYPLIARRLKRRAEAERYDRLLLDAQASFERKFWNEKRGYYRHFEADTELEVGEGCHLGQLAGQGYAELLCLGELLADDPVYRALATMEACNAGERGVLNLSQADHPHTVCPAGMLAQYAALQIYRGRIDAGMDAAKAIYARIREWPATQFNQPMAWHAGTGAALALCRDRDMGPLAVWHVLYAMQGLFLDLARHTLWLRPNLPEGVDRFESPIVTPVCIGTLKFKHSTSGPYHQLVRISFDSPVTLSTIVLSLPEAVAAVDVTCDSDTGEQVVRAVIDDAGRRKLLELTTASPVTVRYKLRIDVREAPACETPAG